MFGETQSLSLWSRRSPESFSMKSCTIASASSRRHPNGRREQMRRRMFSSNTSSCRLLPVGEEEVRQWLSSSYWHHLLLLLLLYISQIRCEAFPWQSTCSSCSRQVHVVLEWRWWYHPVAVVDRCWGWPLITKPWHLCNCEFFLIQKQNPSPRLSKTKVKPICCCLQHSRKPHHDANQSLPPHHHHHYTEIKLATDRRWKTISWASFSRNPPPSRFSTNPLGIQIASTWSTKPKNRRTRRPKTQKKFFFFFFSFFCFFFFSLSLAKLRYQLAET